MRVIDGDALVTAIYKYSFYHENDRDMVCEIIRVQPSVEPQRKGKWIKDDRSTTYQYCCSNCKAYHRARYDFCPSCGANMEEGVK